MSDLLIIIIVGIKFICVVQELIGGKKGESEKTLQMGERFGAPFHSAQALGYFCRNYCRTLKRLVLGRSGAGNASMTPTTWIWTVFCACMLFSSLFS